MKRNVDRRIIFFTIFFLGLSYSNQIIPQNLIPNHSFEINHAHETNAVQGWNEYFAHHTPDYFNLKEKASVNNIFDNYMGGILPKEGNAYMGIFCYRTYPNKNVHNVREFLYAPLNKRMKRDSVYEFKISLCLDAESNVALKNFGALFVSKEKEITDEKVIFQTKPNIVFNQKLLNNTQDWVTLRTDYIANGTEKYIIIGNIIPDSLTYTEKRTVSKDDKKEKWQLAKNELAAYYYIDDLILEQKAFPKRDTLDPLLLPEELDYNITDLSKDSAIVLNNVNFKFNTTEFLDESYDDLKRLFRFMNDHKEVKIKILGHTDNIGNEEYNLQLSYDRAMAVKHYLTERGIANDRAICEGFGDEKPLKPNNSEVNRQFNRRVEFVILNK